jgi:hypothetical protein
MNFTFLAFGRKDTTKLYFITRRVVAVAPGATIKIFLMSEGEKSGL